MMCGNPLKVVAKFALSPDEGGEISGRCLVFARLFCNATIQLNDVCLCSNWNQTFCLIISKIYQSIKINTPAPPKAGGISLN